MAARQHGEGAVLGGGIVDKQAHREHIVVGVRRDSGVLVDFDGGADAAALEVQLAVMKIGRGAESSVTISGIGDSNATQRQRGS
jgi:hypothetical protein